MQNTSSHFSITNTTKGKLPGLPFSGMKNSVLGKSYLLSLVIVGDSRSRKLNLRYRRKNKPANVLAFPLSEQEGEIFLNLARAKREAKLFERNEKNFAGFLFIHALTHLKGFTHSSRMESEEVVVRKKFGI
ncbi:MAG: rRNA maturation RNase YbeY [Candidatus Taylorbacteria bacterium]